MKVTVRRTVMPALLVLVVSVSLGAFAQDENPPETLDLTRVRFQIVDAMFVSKLEGSEGRFQETHMDQYRGMVMTVRITKPAGEQLTLACQDVSLHYRYGQQSDIAKCFGMSTYSLRQDEDRAMALWKEGWGRSSTGTATTRASTVYIDIFFQNMEPETRDLYLFVAQPTGAHFTAAGWKKE